MAGEIALFGKVAADDADASMRPRPIGRGDVADRATLVAVIDASMRPRPIGRGDMRYKRSPYVGFLCFNEASANWPGRLLEVRKGDFGPGRLQ